MKEDLGTWQQSQMRSALELYRKTLDERYHISNKTQIEVEGGRRAYSLLCPPLGSPASQRRLRIIAQNIMDSGTLDAEPHNGEFDLGKSRTPHFLSVAVSYDCQCDCQHCSAYAYRKKVERDGDALSLEELENAVHQSIDLGTSCVILSGGEPLLFSGITDLIRSIDQRQCITIMFTNGELLTDETVKRLKDAGLFGVFVSVDSADAEEHDRHRRRPGLFQKAMDGVKRCQKAGLLTGLSTYISHEKLQDGGLDAVMELAKQQGVMEVFLFDLVATGRLIDDRECMLTRAEADETRAFEARYNETTAYPRVIHQTMFASIAYPCAAQGCAAGVAQLHLRGNGDVSPCDFTPYAFGNVRTEPLAEIWRKLVEHKLYEKGSEHCRLGDPTYWDHLKSAATSEVR